MVTTHSQTRLQALNRPPSVDDFQGRGSDLPVEREEGAEVSNTYTVTPSSGVRQKGVGQRKTVIPKKTILFSWTPNTLPRRLRRNTVGGREGEKIFPSRARASTSSSERAESIEKEKSNAMQQPTPKFGKEMSNFPGANRLRRTPPPSPKLVPQGRMRSPSLVISEEIVQPISTGGNEVCVSVPTENTPTEGAMSEHAQDMVTDNPLWYDRGGLLRVHLPVSNRQGQIGQPLISKEETQRQEWLRWISWIWEARRQGVEAQLPAIIANSKANLDPSIREYDVKLSRMIFRAIVAEAVKRMPTEEEMLYGIREGFILAMQLRDTQQIPTELQSLHRKDDDNSVLQALKLGIGKGNTSPREFSLEHMGNKDISSGKLLNQLKLQQIVPAPRQSKYFTPEQSENESEVGSIQQYQERMPRDIPKDSEVEMVKKSPHQEHKREWKNEVNNEGPTKLTKQLLDNANKQWLERKIKPAVGRGQDPSPSPSSSSTSADERRRRARKEKEKEKEKERKKKKKKEERKRRKRMSDGDDDPPNDSDESSSDSDVGNKNYGKGNFESSSDESVQSEKATKQQRKDFMAILKANAPKKYRGDRDPKILREWVNQVDHYMSMVKLTKRDEVKTILLLLEGDAMLWWRRNWKEFKKKGISSWKTIKRLIVDRFMPLGYRLMLEKQLREVCQWTSAREYESRFTHIVMQLPDYTDKQIISHFINGLKTTVRTQVISHDPTDLEEAIRLAENMDDGLFAEQLAARKTTSVPDPRVTRVTMYKMNQIEGAKKSASTNGERKFPNSIKYYNCGKLGHISRNCKAPRRQQQQTTINESQKIQ